MSGGVDDASCDGNGNEVIDECPHLLGLDKVCCSQKGFEVVSMYEIEFDTIKNNPG